MAEPKNKTAAVTDPGEELTEYTAPLLPGQTAQDIFVAVNGESIRIKRGETVMIKGKFLEVIQHAGEQERAAYAYMDAAKKAGARAAAEL